MQHVLVSWQAYVDKITPWKTFLLRFGWKLHMSQVNRSHGWESSTNTIRKIAHYQIQWDFASTMTFVTPQDIIQAPLSADILSWSLGQSFGLRGKQLYTLAAFWRNSVVYLPSLEPIVHNPPHDAWLLTAASHYWLLLGGLFSKARSTCISQWQQYDLKPQAISHDLLTPSIPPIWDAKDTSTLVFFLHLLHS